MGEPYVEDAGKDPDDPRPALEHERPPHFLASSAAVAGAGAGTTPRERIENAQWYAKYIGRYARVLDAVIPPEYEGVREIARKIAKKADAIVTWADERRELPASGDNPRLQSEDTASDTMREDVGALRAQVVALMRDTYQDPASFHEALARALNISEEEYAPSSGAVFAVTMSADARDHLRAELTRVRARMRAALAYSANSPSEDVVAKHTALVDEALTALDDAVEVE